MYVGCYQDDANRDFDYGPREYGYTADSCLEACADFKYFALQHQGWCSCDNTYGTPEAQYPQLPDNKCGNDLTGRGWSNAVYENTNYVPTTIGYTYIGCF